MARRPTDDGSPVPAVLLRETGRRLRPADLLYRIYLTVLFGGMYGGTLVHAIVTVPTSALTTAELTQLGLVLACLPGVAALAGIHLGRWVGLVPVAPPEAAVLLPTPVRRQTLLRPRALRAGVVLVALLAVTALAATVLLALQRTVTAAAWLAGPPGAAALAVLLAATAARTQRRPLVHGPPRADLLGGALAVAAPVVLALTAPGRDGLVRLAAGLLQAPDPWPIVAVTLIAGMVTAIAAAAAIRHLDEIHDEELRARAGMHAGLGASLRLGDLRAVRLSRDPGSRTRAGRRLALPARGAGVVRWRHLVAHRTRPGGLVRVVVGWGLATALVVGPAQPSTWTAAVLRMLVAGALAYAATVPLVEPMRRDHDSPLAAELLPFGYAHLQRLHVRVCLTIGLVVIVPTTVATQLVLAPQLPGWSGAAGGLLAGTCAVLAAADRVRQPGSLAESMASMPMGATPEMLGVAVAGMLLLPVFAMVPAGLPIGFALAAPLLPVPVAPLIVAGALLGAMVLGLRWLGLKVWLDAAESSLADASAPEPGSSLPIAWRQLRARRAGDNRHR